MVSGSLTPDAARDSEMVFDDQRYPGVDTTSRHLPCLGLTTEDSEGEKTICQRLYLRQGLS